MKPSGVSKTFIDKGFNNSYTILPPKEIWDTGVWFVQLTNEQQASITTTIGNNAWECWIVNGEGTPGNFMARIYVVPEGIAAEMEPDHPLLWPDKHKITTGFSYGGYSGGYSGNHSYQGTSQVSTRPPTTQAQALPTGIRFRCAECGHWFKQTDLAPHKTNCCPGKEESRESDWAILCECCQTLDQVGQCKPGFPRPKKEVVPKEKTESKEAVKATAETVQ
jgi:hypothetical protein